MAFTELSTHQVTDFEIGQIRSLSSAGGFTRSILIEDSKGHRVEITMFAETASALALKLNDVVLTEKIDEEIS